MSVSSTAASIENIGAAIVVHKNAAAPISANAPTATSGNNGCITMPTAAPIVPPIANAGVRVPPMVPTRKHNNVSTVRAKNNNVRDANMTRPVASHGPLSSTPISKVV